MKLTKSKLKKIIKEELQTLLKEETVYDFEPEEEWGKLDYGAPEQSYERGAVPYMIGDFEGLPTAASAHLPQWVDDPYSMHARGGHLPGGYEPTFMRFGPSRWDAPGKIARDPELDIALGVNRDFITTRIPGKFADWSGDPGLAYGYQGDSRKPYPRPWQLRDWSKWTDKDLGIYGQVTGLDDEENIILQGYRGRLHPETQLPAYKREMYRRWLKLNQWPPEAFPKKDPPTRIPKKYFDSSEAFNAKKYFNDWLLELDREAKRKDPYYTDGPVKPPRK